MWVTVHTRGISHLEIAGVPVVYGSRQSAKGIERTSCPHLVEMLERAAPESNSGTRGHRLARVVTLGFRCHGRKRAISRLGRQPRQRRQLRCRGSERQQLLGRQPQRQHRRFVCQAVNLYPETPAVISGSFCYRSLVDFIHPPSIRPTSSRFASMRTYCLPSMAFRSFMSRTHTLRKLSRTLVFSKVGSFSCFDCWLANSIPSRISIRSDSHFCQSV